MSYSYNRRVGSFTDIDPRIHKAMDVQVKEMLFHVNKVADDLAGFTHSMYPPERRDCDRIENDLLAAQGRLNQLRKLIP